MLVITPKISIITCFLNTEQYIRETIESVLKQDYNNWELLLIDDGSIDNSTGIAKAFAAEYPEKIIYLEHENHINNGSSISRNLGIKNASGTLIAFLDADDIWLPDMLSTLLTIMQRYPAAMICEASEYWYDWDGSRRKNEIVTIGAEQNRLYMPPQLALTLYPLSQGAAPCICGMLVQKEILTRHGAFDESFRGMYDDQSLLIKFYLQEPVYISSSCKNRYRQRSGSLVHTSHQKGAYRRDRKYFLSWLKHYLKSNNVHYPEVDILLLKALKPFQPAWFVSHILPAKVKRIFQKVYHSKN